MTRERRSFSSEFKLQMVTFNHQDNLSDEEKELIKLRKEVQHLKMENDILKQVALIMGQK